MKTSRHPHHDQLRVVCSSGFILGRPQPLPPIQRLDTTYRVGNRSPEQIERYKEAARRGWEARRAR